MKKGKKDIVVFNINRILYSLGNEIYKLFNCPIYINPNQQSTELPCFFIQVINSELNEGINRDIYRLSIDIIKLVDYNKNDMFESFYDDIAILDANLDNIPFLDENEVAHGSFGLHDRNFTLDRGRLSYKVNTFLRMYRADIEQEMNGEKLRNLILKLSIGQNKEVEKTYEINI